MRTKRLGDSDLELTVLGIGTWAIGGDWEYGWGPQEERDSIRAILEGLESGINWIDTAAAYGFGVSEEVVGKAVREFGAPVIVATKCGILKSGNKIKRLISRQAIEQEVDASLRRLRVECIDLYQIHWPVPEAQIEEAFATLLDLRTAGKIRWAGVSNFSAAQLERCRKLGPVTSLQPPYSLLDRSIESEILPWCQHHNTGVVVYSPMASGLLTGKVNPAWVAALDDRDWRKKSREHHLMRYLWEPALSKLMGFVKELAGIARESGHTPAQLAVAWALNNPVVTSAIAGARKPGQLCEVVEAAAWQLTAEELNAVDQAYHQWINA